MQRIKIIHEPLALGARPIITRDWIGTEMFAIGTVSAFPPGNCSLPDLWSMRDSYVSDPPLAFVVRKQDAVVALARRNNFNVRRYWEMYLVHFVSPTRNFIFISPGLCEVDIGWNRFRENLISRSMSNTPSARR